MEKQLSGKAMEKFPDYKTVSVSMKRNGTKESTCGDCGIISTVRKDMTLIMGSMLKECQMATRMKLMGIIRATA